MSKKAARAALDASDFEEALRICEEGLSADSSDYMLLVLKGMALQRSGAHGYLDVFRKATGVNGELPLAWQAIVSSPVEDPGLYAKAVMALNEIMPEKAPDLNARATEALTGRPLIDFIEFLKGRAPRDAVPLLRRQLQLWREWEQAAIEERFKKQRYSISAGPLPALRQRITDAVFRESGLAAVLEELHDWGEDCRVELAERLFALKLVDKLGALLGEGEDEALMGIVLETGDGLDTSRTTEYPVYSAFKACAAAYERGDFEAVLRSDALELLQGSPFPMPTRSAAAKMWRGVALCRSDRVGEALEVSDAGPVLEAAVQAHERGGKYLDAIQVALRIPGFDETRLAWLYYRDRQFDKVQARGDALLGALMLWHEKRYHEAQFPLTLAVGKRFAAHYQWRVKRDSAAYALYIGALGEAIDDIEAAVGAAEILLFQDRSQDALALLEPFAPRNPLYALFWKLLGIAYLRHASFGEAARCFQHALRGTGVQFENDAAPAQAEPALLGWLAEAYIADGRLESAYKILHRIEGEREQLALLCIRLGHFREALSLAIADASLANDVRHMALSGLLLEAMSEGLAWRPILGAIGDLPGPRTFMACKAAGDAFRFAAYVDGSYRERARVFYRSSDDPVLQARYRTDLALLDGDPAAALEALQSNDDAYSNLAMSMSLKEKPLKAQHFACKALALEPSLAPAWHHLAVSVYADADLRRAALDAAVSHCPSDRALLFARVDRGDATALRQVLALDAHRHQLADQSSRECPAYLTDAYEAFVGAASDEDWMKLLAMQRLVQMGLEAYRAPLRSLLGSRGWTHLAQQLQ